MAEQDNPLAVAEREKLAAARAAAALVENGMLLGLGSGSTSLLAVREIGARMKKENLRIEAVCTSRATLELGRQMAIPCYDPPGRHSPDLYIDGADQIDPEGRMIKGGGGALLREKIIATRSKRRVIIVDSRKTVQVLGHTFPLPVDVVPFALELVLEDLGRLPECEPMPRMRPDGEFFLTDDGNLVVDCRFRKGIADPAAMAARLGEIVGVVETGLFIGLCDELIIGRDGVDTEHKTFSSGNV